MIVGKEGKQHGYQQTAKWTNTHFNSQTLSANLELFNVLLHLKPSVLDIEYPLAGGAPSFSIPSSENLIILKSLHTYA